MALEDDDLRRKVRESIATSPYREGKLSFNNYLTKPEGTSLKDRMGQRGSLSESEIDGLLSQAPGLELYMPVPEHWKSWDGGIDVVVASSLRDHEIPVGFRPSGEEFTFLSAEEPPTVPVLALVPVETDFSARAEGSIAPSSAGGGTHSSFAEGPQFSSSSSSSDGIYMTAAYIPDDHEGFLRGAPEFEIHFQVQQTSQDTAFDVRCAGNDAPDPTSQYDHNDDLWEGWVRVASKSWRHLTDWHRTLLSRRSLSGKTIRILV